MFKTRYVLIDVLCHTSIITAETARSSRIAPARESNRSPQQEKEQQVGIIRKLQGHFQNGEQDEQGSQNCQRPTDMPYMQNQVAAPPDPSDDLVQFRYGCWRIHNVSQRVVDFLTIGE